MKLKLFIIISLGILSFLYNFKSGFYEFFHNSNYQLLMYSYLGVNCDDSYLGIIFDFLISFFFNINLKNVNSFFRFLGG